MLKEIVKMYYRKIKNPTVTISKTADVSIMTIFGSNVIVSGKSSVSSSVFGDYISVNASILSGVRIGSYSYIASGCKMSFLEIWKFCSIGPQCLAGLGEHPVNQISSSPVFYSTKMQCGFTFSDRNYVEENKLVTIKMMSGLGQEFS